MQKWYVVNIFYEGLNIKHPDTPSTWEENIIIISALDRNEAQEKAKVYALKEEAEYPAVDGNIVKWVFRGIGEINVLDSDKLTDGMEIFSRFLKDHEAKNFFTSLE